MQPYTNPIYGGDTMKYFDKDKGAALKAAFDDVVLDWPDVAVQTMFGCPSYRADGDEMGSGHYRRCRQD